MMEEAERAVYANAWVPSAPVNLDMDAPQISRQLPSGVQAFRDLAGRYNPRSQARSLAQLQELMQFDFGQEPAGVTDRLVAFERLVGEYKTSSGEVLGVQVKCTVLLEREFRRNSGHTCCSPVVPALTTPL